MSKASTGTKHDSGKVRLGLVPPQPLVEVAKVFTFGAQKYEPWNYLKGIQYSRLYDAAMRHMLAWAMGDDKDEESGHQHLAHAICCLMMIMAQDDTDMDDRPHRIGVYQ